MVISELPRTRETLLLRLLGSRRARQEAVAEIHAVPLTDPEGLALREFLGCLQHLVCHDTQIVGENRQDIMTAAMAEIKQMQRQFFNQGVEKTLRQAVMDLCEVVGVEITPQRRAQIQELDMEGLERLRQGLKQTRAWPSG